jgi:hypothetical protein
MGLRLASWRNTKDARGLLSVAEKSKQPEEKLVLDSVAARY